MLTKFVRLATAGVVLVAAGCVTGRTASLPDGAGSDWGTTLARAEAAAGSHRYADADRLLADFATRYPGTEGATESAYWRGVFALEPANHDGTPQMAAAFFDVYAKAAGALPHRLEAEIFRDLAFRLQAGAAPTVAIATPSPASSSSPAASSADLKAKDTEIQRLKDELAKANDELERIKRRLTAPTKP